jgi:hypothetical protein
MSKATDIIKAATAEVGYSEIPANSNKTKFGVWAGLNGVAWCGIFASWAYNKGGAPLPKIGFAFPGYAGCQTAMAYFTKTGEITTTPQPGDLVFFDWNADGRYDHTGIFIRDLGKGYFESVEGNTAVGNDSNGGEVMIRKRSYKVAKFVHPKVLDK